MLSPEPAEPQPPPQRPSLLDIFLVALRLGLTSFGGPVAHLGYFHAEYVVRRKWVDEKAYADLMALCQFLPGPASSQLGFGIGMARGGIPGGFSAWLGFTLPSAILMIAFGCGVNALGAMHETGGLRGLKLVAVAVVAQAILGMAKKLCPNRASATVAIFAAGAVLLWPAGGCQIAAIALGGVLGWMLYRKAEEPLPSTSQSMKFNSRQSIFALTLFFGLLLGLPILAAAFPKMGLAYFDSYYRAGALVFGGGHVVLPLLKAQAVTPGWVSENSFLAGYGAAQALPGPLFTFAAYLGTIAKLPPNGVPGGLLALGAIFLSPLLLMIGVIPMWEMLRKKPAAAAVLKGANAAVVGVLVAAFYDPVWTGSVHSAPDFVLALAAFGALVFWSCPPWLVVALGALGGWWFLK